MTSIFKSRSCNRTYQTILGFSKLYGVTVHLPLIQYVVVTVGAPDPLPETAMPLYPADPAPAAPGVVVVETNKVGVVVVTVDDPLAPQV